MTEQSGDTFTHRFQGRSWAVGGVLVAVWLGVLLLWALVDMADWLVVALLLFTLPAAWEFAKGAEAVLELDDTQLRWRAGRAEGTVALAKITQLRLETRLDFSVRVRILADGQRIVLPQACVPPHRPFEAALQARGVAVFRRHFGL